MLATVFHDAADIFVQNICKAIPFINVSFYSVQSTCPQLTCQNYKCYFKALTLKLLPFPWGVIRTTISAAL